VDIIHPLGNANTPQVAARLDDDEKSTIQIVEGGPGNLFDVDGRLDADDRIQSTVIDLDDLSQTEAIDSRGHRPSLLALVNPIHSGSGAVLPVWPGCSSS
jgi:hypothetical protein